MYVGACPGPPGHYSTDGYACAIQFYASLPTPGIKPPRSRGNSVFYFWARACAVVAELTRSSASFSALNPLNRFSH